MIGRPVGISEKSAAISTAVAIAVLLFNTVGLAQNYECLGQFRSGYECSNAIDGDWMTSAVPNLYNDSVSITQYHSIPPGTLSARWIYKVLRNNPDIGVRAEWRDYAEAAWKILHVAPVDLDYTVYDAVAIPPEALLVSPLMTRVCVKNAGAMSGEFFEGVVDWQGWFSFDRLGDYNCDGVEDAVDLALLIDRVFFGGSPACPCPTQPQPGSGPCPYGP